MNKDYPGNISLSPDVRERVMQTFQQTLELYKQGRIEEVVMGCDFLMKLDSSFEPARQLLAKANDPSLPIDVDALMGNDDISSARDALQARDFQLALELSSSVLARDPGDPEAQLIGDEARERLEALPFVDQFLSKARSHFAVGNETAARSELEKARSLDPTHPDILEIENRFPSTPAPSGFGSGDESSAFGGFGESSFGESSFGESSFGGSAQPSFDTPSFGGPASFGGGSFGSSAPDDSSASFVVDVPQSSPGGDFGSDSFVVDATPAPSASEPVDFGFTFEESAAQPVEKAEPPPAAAFSFGTEGGAAADFSFGAEPGSAFDTPPPASGAPGTSDDPRTFDFSTSSIESTPEDQARINQYLKDGDACFEKRDFQAAIDLWSRIFLIDVTNQEASERIDRAKVKRQEVDRKVDELVRSGIQSYDRRDMEAARRQLTEALELDPENYDASDYLRKIDEGGPESPAAGSFAPTGRGESSDLLDDDFSIGEETLVPPEPDTAASSKAAKGKGKGAQATKDSKKKSVSMLPIVGLAALIIFGVGGYFGYKAFFPGKPAYDSSQTAATLAKAQTLGAAGKFDEAIDLLRKIPAEDPEQNRALALIDELKSKKAQASGMIGGRPAAEVYAELLVQGKASFEAHDYVSAKESLEKAAAIKPLPADEKALFDQASEQVGKLDSARLMFKEGNYKDAVTLLEGLLQQDGSNKNVQKMLVDARFNMGATALREERTADAGALFDQVLAAQPDDALAKRSKEIAVRYDGETKDLLYRIYVKYLPMR